MRSYDENMINDIVEDLTYWYDKYDPYVKLRLKNQRRNVCGVGHLLTERVRASYCISLQTNTKCQKIICVYGLKLETLDKYLLCTFQNGRCLCIIALSVSRWCLYYVF